MKYGPKYQDYAKNQLGYKSRLKEYEEVRAS
jgi:hypothetical protein